MTLQEIWEKHYKSKKISKKTFKELISLDPTTIKDDSGSPVKPGRYTKWILRAWLNKALPEEDFYKVTEYLSPLNRFRFVTKDLDIMKAKTLPDLYELVQDLLERKSQKETMEAIKADGLVCLYNKAPWQVYRVDTWEASKLIGAGTQWCTASKYSDSNFRSYSKTGPLIVFIRDNKDKYQYHKNVGLYTASDRPTNNPAIFNEINPIATKLRKEMFGISFEVDEIRLNTEYRTVIRLKGESLEFDNRFFDNRFILARKVKLHDESERVYYCSGRDKSDYVILNAKTGAIVDNFLDTPKPEFQGKNNNVIVVRDARHKIREFVIYDNGFGIRRFKTDLEDHIKYHWYGIEIEKTKDKINCIVAENKMYQVDIQTGKVEKIYDVYYLKRDDTRIQKWDKKYYRDQATGEFIGSQPPVNIGVWHGARRDIKNELLISEFTMNLGDNKRFRFRYNRSYYDYVDITFSKDKVKYGTKNVLSDWPSSRDMDFVYIQNPGFNGLTNNGQRRIIVTPYGWTFWNGSAVIKATEAVWYAIDPSRYLGNIDCLWQIEIKGKSRKPKNLGRKKYSWFDHLFDLYCPKSL